MKEKHCAAIGNLPKASMPTEIVARAKTFLDKQDRVAQSSRSTNDAKDNDEESDDDDYDGNG